MTRRIDQEGTVWYYNERGFLHREDGPVVEFFTGYKSWFQDGELHRLDGPAIEYSNRCKEYWINGQQYTEEEYRVIVFSLGLPYE